MLPRDVGNPVSTAAYFFTGRHAGIMTLTFGRRRVFLECGRWRPPLRAVFGLHCGFSSIRPEQPEHRLVRLAMKQLRSDFAAIAQPGYWIALGLLVLPYGIGVFFLVRICRCM